MSAGTGVDVFRLTDCTNDLAFDTELILISTGDPTDRSTLRYTDIRRILDSIPHVSGCECQNEDNGEYTPDDPRLNEWQKHIP